jgi:hypothetical protein
MFLLKKSVSATVIVMRVDVKRFDVSGQAEVAGKRP